MKAKRVSPANKEKGAEEGYVQMKVMEQEIEQLKEQLQRLESQQEEVTNTMEAVRAFARFKQGDRALAPIANGIFFQCSITQTERLKLNVGGGVVVERSPEECIELLKGHEKQIITQQQQIISHYQTVVDRMQHLESEVKPR